MLGYNTSMKGILQSCAVFVVSMLVLVPLAANAAASAQNIGLVGAGVGVGLLLSQALNNSANDTCKGCQNVDATKPNYCQARTCSTVSSGYTITGKCGAPGECRATSAQGMGGSSINLGTVLQVVGLLATLSQLSQQSGGSVPPQGYSAPPQGCTGWRTVTTPSTDPCAIYNPTPVSGTIVATPISDFSGGGSSAPVSDALLNLINSAAREGGTDIGSQLEQLASGTSSGAIGASSTIPITLNGNLAGDAATSEVKEGGAGATIVANLRQGLTEVAGFFGSTFSGDSQQSFGSRLCTNRPWATGLLAKLFAPWIFDNICSKLGFQVGAVTPVGPTFESRQVTPGTRATLPAPTPKAVLPAEADIWADPTSVRLGTRGKIFWSSANVDSCKISGPSFEHDALSGGGATVPITGPTTFTILCEAPGGAVRDSVTVNLTI